MNQKVLQRLDIENSLRRAIEKEEFVLFYQPQIDIKTGKIVGFEALLRWYHPDYGLMPPMEFIPVAEDSGLIVVIGEWVLETACRQNKKWIECGLEPHLISVNLSARQFQRSNIVEVIDRIRSKHRFGTGAFGAGNNGEHCDARLEFYNRCFESVEEKGNKGVP